MANLSGTYTSPYSSPTFKYDISYSQTGRTASTVTYKVTVSAYMTHSSSWFGYALNGYIDIGGKQTQIIAKGNTTWSGTSKHTFTKTITCNTNSSSGTVSAKFWTTTPNSPGKSGQISVSGTFNKTASSSSGGGGNTGGGGTHTSKGYIFKKVNGTWKDYCDIKGITKKTSGSWKDAIILRRTSGKWIQIYPVVTTGSGSGGSGGSTSTGGYVIVKGGTHRYKNNTHNWDAGVAKQGTWGYGSCYGVFGINRNQFKGNGNVTKVTGAYITGYRDASGYYNNNQTIRFYRSNNSGSGSSIGYAGNFTATTGAPGANKWMIGNRTISELNNVRDFLNGVSGYNNLLIYSSAKSDYLGLKNVSLAVKYEYKPVVAYFDNPEKATYMSEAQLKEEAINQPYLTMLLYPEEVHMTLDEIFKRRMLLGIPDIDATTLKPVEPNDPPYSGDYKVRNGKLTVELSNIFDNRVAQYSLDGDNWDNLTFNVVTGLYEGDIVGKYQEIYIRVIDVAKDELLYQHKYDKPKILISN